MRLLITWAQDCPPAVDALLMPAGRIPMLLDLTQHKYVLTSLLLLIFLGDMAHTSSVARSRVLDVGMLSPDLLISAYTGRGTGGESVQTMKDGRVLFISSCNAPSPLRLEKRVIVISGEEAFRHFRLPPEATTHVLPAGLGRGRSHALVWLRCYWVCASCTAHPPSLQTLSRSASRRPCCRTSSAHAPAWLLSLACWTPSNRIPSLCRRPLGLLLQGRRPAAARHEMKVHVRSTLCQPR